MAGVRAVGHVLLFGFLDFAFLIVYRVFAGPVHGGPAAVVRMLFELPVLLLISAWCARHFLQEPLSALGVGWGPGRGQALARGLLLGAGMVALATLAATALGALHVTGCAPTRPSRLAFITLGYAMGAASEELMFRGFPLQTMARDWGPLPATLCLSALFGLAHVGNPDHTLLSVTNTVLAGFLLCAAYFRTRALWLPYGLHLGWNLAQNFLGVAVSGLSIPGTALLAMAAAGPTWLSGGSYGLEGSVLVTPILMLGSWLLWPRASRAEASAAAAR